MPSHKPTPKPAARSHKRVTKTETPVAGPVQQLTGGQAIRKRAAESGGPQSEADRVIANKGRKPDDEGGD